MKKTLVLLLSYALLSTNVSHAAPQSGTASQQPTQPVFVPDATPSDSQSAKLAPGIKILILEGKTNPNRLTEGTWAVPLVEVRNSNDQPVESAKVTFVLPGGKMAGASFADGSLEKTVFTNFQGQAMAEGYRPNPVAGKFIVKIRATFGEDSTEISLPQETTFSTRAEDERKSRGKWKKWALIGGLAAGGIIAAVLLTRDSASSGPPLIIVTPGGPTIGGR